MRITFCWAQQTTYIVWPLSHQPHIANMESLPIDHLKHNMWRIRSLHMTSVLPSFPISCTTSNVLVPQVPDRKSMFVALRFQNLLDAVNITNKPKRKALSGEEMNYILAMLPSASPCAIENISCKKNIDGLTDELWFQQSTIRARSMLKTTNKKSIHPQWDGGYLNCQFKWSLNKINRISQASKRQQTPCQ